MNRVERLTATLLLLHDGQHTAGEIARRFEVSRRTVLRDMQSLYAMGVPVESRDGAGGGYSLPVDYTRAPLELDAAQSFLLLLALDGLDRMADAPFPEARAALGDRLRAALPREHLPAVDRLLEAVHLSVPRRRRRTPHLQALLAAIQHRRWLRISYRSAEHEAEHHILPRSLYAGNGYWYCRAYGYERSSERTFRVDRIRKLAPAGTSYQRIAAPSTPAYDDPSHPEVVVELTARGAALLESEPHIGELIEHDRAGAVWLRFRCPPSELDYYARLFAGLGADAVVSSPPELCRRLFQLALQLGEAYRR